MVRPPTWLLEWSEVLSAVGILLLTFVLVILYKHQKDIQQEEHRGIVDVVDYRFEGDDVYLKLSNYGNSPIESLNLVTLVYADNGGHENYVARGNALKRQDREGEWSNILSDGEEEIPFKGSAKVGMPAPEETEIDWVSISFGNLLSRLKDSGAESVKFLLTVGWTEVSRGENAEPVHPSTFEVDLTDDWDGRYSLEDLPNRSMLGSDHTFDQYFTGPDFPQLLYLYYVYYGRWLGLKRFISEPNPLNASGLARVGESNRSRLKSVIGTITGRSPRQTLFELAALGLLPGFLALIYYWTPQSFQAQMVLDHTDPQLHTFWTASFIHEHRPDDSHLIGNIVGYLLLIYPTWLLYRVKNQTRRFWLIVAVILTVGPLVINGGSYFFLHEYLNLQILRDRGFSGIVGAFTGFLLMSILNTVGEEQEEKTAILSSGLYATYLMLGFGLVTIRPPIIGLGVLFAIMTIFGIRTGYVSTRGELAEWVKNNRMMAAVLTIAAFVSVLAFTASLPAEITNDSGGFTNIASHGFGILFGMVIEYQKTVRRNLTFRKVVSRISR